MATLTTRLGLTKPAGAEKQDISVLNTDFDTLDRVAGMQLVNDNITPPNSSLYDGAIVMERNSGIAWVAVANGVGGFNKKWLYFPGTIVVSNGPVAMGNGTTFTGIALTSTFAQRNAPRIANFDAIDTLTVLQSGIYDITAVATWAQNNNGNRGLRVLLNNAQASFSVTDIADTSNVDGHTTLVHLNGRVLNAGDALRLQGYQNSGGSLTVNRAELALSLKAAI